MQILFANSFRNNKIILDKYYLNEIVDKIINLYSNLLEGKK